MAAANSYPREILLAAFNGLQAHGQGSLDRFATVDEALASPHAPLVRMHAYLLSIGKDPFAKYRTHHRPQVLRPDPPPLAGLLRHPPAARDHKRAAAGDTD